MNDKKKLLIVDDETIIQKLFRDFLQDEYVVFSASNGEEALKMLADNPVDCIFCDIHMPLMSGVEVLKSVKDQFKGIPIIMMDSFPEISAKKLGDMGAFAFIHKPFYLREIRSVLKEVIHSGVSNEQYSGDNRRKSPRFSSVLEMTYKIDGIEGHDEEKTLSKNLSSTGLLIETTQYLKKGMVLILKIKLPREQVEERYLTIKGDVRWCMEKRKGERYDTGVQFQENQETELEEINKLLGTYFV